MKTQAKELTRLAVSALIAFIATTFIVVALSFQSWGLFVLESAIALSLVNPAFWSGLRLSMPGLKVQMAGSIDHGHGSGLHWLVSFTFGAVASFIVVQTFLVPTNTFNLNNWFAAPVVLVTFIGFWALGYYILREY
jgi:hypothetical protein